MLVPASEVRRISQIPRPQLTALELQGFPNPAESWLPKVYVPPSAIHIEILAQVHRIQLLRSSFLSLALQQISPAAIPWSLPPRHLPGHTRRTVLPFGLYHRERAREARDRTRTMASTAAFLSPEKSRDTVHGS